MQLHVLKERKLRLLVIFHPVISFYLPLTTLMTEKKIMDLIRLSIILIIEIQIIVSLNMLHYYYKKKPQTQLIDHNRTRDLVVCLTP